MKAGWFREGAAHSARSAGGWFGVLRLSFREFNADHIPAAAASVTFFFLLALFPALSAIVSIYGLFATGETAAPLLRFLHGVMPPGGVRLLSDNLDRLAKIHGGGLSLALVVSVVVSIWSANSGIKALIAALDIAYEADDQRNFVRLNAVSLAFTLGLIALALLGLGMSLLALPTVNPSGPMAQMIAVLRWPVLLAVVVGLICALYRFGPARAPVGQRVLLPGACFASLAWLAVSQFFSWYVSHFAHYDVTYGSLGAVVGFLTWIWLSLIMVLFGAELNAALEQHRPATRVR